jgi:LPXTG-motif cell wall-anchored protein
VGKHLAPLIAVYIVACALVLVGGSVAAEQDSPNVPSSGKEAQAGPTGVETTQAPPPPAAPNQPEPQQQQQATAPEPTPAPESSPPVAVAAGPGSVSIVDYSFGPASITVDVGDTVTWTNTGKQGHSATGSGFDTGILSKGQSGSHTFTSPGSFSYHCTPHPFMKGTVVVRAASSGGGSGGGSSGGGTGGGSSGGDTDATGSQADSSTGSGSASSGGSGLPATGADAAVLAGLGLALFGLGLAIRRRAAA